MSLQWIEQLGTTRPTDLDNKGHLAIIRRGVVATTSPDAARGAELAPKVGDRFPDDARLLCDRIVTSPSGRGQTMLDAYYSNDGRFNTIPPRTNPDPPAATDWVWGSRDVEIGVPINKRTSVSQTVINGLGQQTNVTKEMWVLDKIVITQTFGERNLIVRVPCPPPEQLYLFDIITAQRNKIHTIRGGKYLYSPPSNNVRKIDAATYEIRHSWIEDVGTPYQTSYAANDRALILPPSFTGGAFPTDPGLLRHPYTRLDYTAPADPTYPNGYWLTIERSDYTEDADGWRYLPGVPPL